MGRASPLVLLGLSLGMRGKASEMLGASVEQVACPGQLWSWKEGMYEIPMIAPSGDWSLATV